MQPIGRRLDPFVLAVGAFLLYLLTRTEFHTFDGIAYTRDVSTGKPLAALVLPHHLAYEPVVLAMFNIWRALGWTGHADAPAQFLSSLAGAGGLALFYRTAWEWTRTRLAALLATLALGLSYGYWFYSVEVDIYLPPLFFLLLSTWLLTLALRRGAFGWVPVLLGLSHAGAVLFHQVALLVAPAFALGLWLGVKGNVRARVGAVARYGVTLGAVVWLAYFVGGWIVAGQSTPESFMRWANSYGTLGTWGGFRTETAGNVLSGVSAALSSDFWTGRLLLVGLVVLLAITAVAATRQAGALAWALWAWLGVPGAFFVWWQPEVLKFWVLVLPAPLLLIAMGAAVPEPRPVRREVYAGAVLLALAALVATNAPAIWAKRDPMSDPARRASATLGERAGSEDLIVLQASPAEHYLPFLYSRPNVTSARELWYSHGGAGGRAGAIREIRQRAWHALAKGSSVWVEDRVMQPGEPGGDFYVFSPEQIEQLRNLYGTPMEWSPPGHDVPFWKASPETARDMRTEWRFSEDENGWSGVNVVGERFGPEGWCFVPAADPNLYGPPVQLEAAQYSAAEIELSSPSEGRAQLFFRADPTAPYAEDSSTTFTVGPGTRTYRLPLSGPSGWTGLIAGLRLDPLESGDGREVCVKRIGLVR
jgi:hypothetical protein